MSSRQMHSCSEVKLGLRKLTFPHCGCTVKHGHSHREYGYSPTLCFSFPSRVDSSPSEASQCGALFGALCRNAVVPVATNARVAFACEIAPLPL